MRAYEFINEGQYMPRVPPVPKHHSDPMTGIHKFTDEIDRIYMINRVMMAVASTDGKIKPNMQGSWVAKTNTAHPYTDVESDMLRLAYDAVGIDAEIHGDAGSHESEGVNSKSPVSPFKGYKK